MYEQISVRNDNGLSWITIERESKMNALNIALLQEIKAAVLAANADDKIRIIILTGAGSKAFAAGADISEFAEFSVEQARDMSAAGHEVMNIIERSGKPVIAAVNGFALGGGCELAMACHIRIASENTRFGQPEVNLGVPPGYGGTQRLLHIVGKGRALHMLLSGDAIDAQTALHWGLVSKVVPVEELHSEAEKLAGKLIAKSPLAMSKVIECVNAYYDAGVAGMKTEIEAFGWSFGEADFKEGTDAFLQKRKPSF